MLYLECEVKKPAGLREADVLAIVRDASGRSEQLVLERAFLVERARRTFLPVWGISQNEERTKVQVELPFESAGGTNRIWVRGEQVFVDQEKQEVPT